MDKLALRRDRVAAGRALRACVGNQTERARALLSARPGAQARFVSAAHRHGVPGYAWRAIEGSGVLSPELEHELQAGFYWAVARHMRTVTELVGIGAVLDGADVDWLVFKGPVLAEGVHSEPGLRGYNDLDVLVRPSHLGRALQALEAAGGATLDKNWDLLLRELRGEVHVVAPQGTIVDLHWHLINQPRARGTFELNMDELMDRRMSVEVGGLQVPTFDPADAVVHLALHTVLSGGDRLVWFKDIERSVVSRPPDWPAIADRCARWRTGLVVDVALRRTAALIAPVMPTSSELELHSSRTWMSALQTACALSPGDALPGAGSLARMTSKATGHNLRGSSSQLMRKVGLAACPGRPSNRTRRVEPTSAGSMHYEAGGHAARTTFLSAVQRQSSTAISSKRT